AGFELNSAQVAGRVAEFLSHRLQNDKPVMDVIAARRRGSAFSPDDPDIVAPMQTASLLFMGAGSPTYAVRQLHDTRAWHTLQAAHRQGAAVVLASAATLAASAHLIPVYEIFKAGEDPHWRDGLGLLDAFGLHLIFVPHWNNAEGGADLDTSRCFMGQPRFDELLNMLPAGHTLVGIDEHTALVLDWATETCDVIGVGSVTVIRDGAAGRTQKLWASRESFSMRELGAYQLPMTNIDIPQPIWDEVQSARALTSEPEAPPDAVLALVAEREAARKSKDWPIADAARKQLAELGWQVKDTPQGPRVERIG
ncbi:MAG: CysS/YqeB C-terminal domain-containing protein, partial [Anaerolineales bacterium]